MLQTKANIFRKCHKIINIVHDRLTASWHLSTFDNGTINWSFETLQTLIIKLVCLSQSKLKYAYFIIV